MKKVQIIMAVYNGQMFLREQLDSLISQTYPDISILIRDDESSDDSIEIIEQYQQKHKNIRLICGKNIGVANSFLELIKEADEADYYGFCDQDDYWLPDKISKAVEAISCRETSDADSIFYCCGYEIVDEHLKPTGKRSVVLSESDHSFANALVDTLSIGCSIVINKRLLEILKENIPSYCFMHDYWFYMVAEAINSIFILDSNIGVKYRRHASNFTLKNSYVKRISSGFARMFDSHSKCRSSRQTLALKELFYDNLSVENKESLDCLINSNQSFKNSLKLLFNKNIRKRDMFGRFGLKIRILFRLL